MFGNNLQFSTTSQNKLSEGYFRTLLCTQGPWLREFPSFYSCFIWVMLSIWAHQYRNRQPDGCVCVSVCVGSYMSHSRSTMPLLPTVNWPDLPRVRFCLIASGPENVGEQMECLLTSTAFARSFLTVGFCTVIWLDPSVNIFMCFPLETVRLQKKFF